MTSSDGYCSTLTFRPGELGQPYTGEVPTSKHHQPALSTAVSSSQNTPMATPTSSFAPPSPFHHQRTSSNLSVAPSPPPAPQGPTMRPSSPTRSNSTSSIATQSSYAPGSIISNPTLVPGTLPAPTAGAGAGFLSNIPMATPPQTPRSTSGSVSGVKRAGDASESEREDGGEKKKRRVAPTLVGEPAA